MYPSEIRFSYAARTSGVYDVALSGVSVAPGARALTRDPVRRELDGERPREADDAALRRDVGRQVRERLHVGGRADVDDPPAARRGHVARGDPAAPDVAEEVDVEQVAPVLLGRLEKGLHQRPGGVVDPDVESPVRLDRGCGGALEVGRHPGVADEMGRPASSDRRPPPAWRRRRRARGRRCRRPRWRVRSRSPVRCRSRLR